MALKDMENMIIFHFNNICLNLVSFLSVVNTHIFLPVCLHTVFPLFTLS